MNTDVSSRSCGLCWCVSVCEQVAVSMYKRGAQGWLGKPLIATATIPSSTRVIFRIRGEATDAKIPAGSIRSITLSIWSQHWRFIHSAIIHSMCSIAVSIIQSITTDTTNVFITRMNKFKYFKCALYLFNDRKWFSAALIFDNCWEMFCLSNQTVACIVNRF